MKALILNNKIVQISDREFPVHPDLSWTDCPDLAEVGDSLVEGNLTKTIVESETLSYSELRSREYPNIGDQLDAIMKWAATETEITLPQEFKSLAMKCMSVKAKYPKPKDIETE